jgi:hypothetical protein
MIIDNIFESGYAGNTERALARNMSRAINSQDTELNEFAPSGDGGGSGDYFQALASAWYNGTFDSGSLQKGIKSQQDVEQLLQRGIIGPDGVTRKYGIDYNSTFDGVIISSDDYYEHADHDETDSRTGKPFGPYDYMEFGDEELDEGLTEFAADDGSGGGEEDALHKYARMWWAGDEATQMQIERALAKMGWEIGEDEGGYDNGGVFVVRAGDINGNSYTSWPAEDLTEGFARRPRPRNSFRSAQIGYTPDGPLPMADYSKYPTAVIMKAITDLNQDREKNPELIKLLTKELFKRRQQQGVAEGIFNSKPNPVLPIVDKIAKVAGGLTPQNVETGKQIIQANARDITRILSPQDKAGVDVIEQGVAEGSDDPFGPQGRFVGDTGPAQISATVSRVPLRIGDRVLYKPTEQHARIMGLSQDGTQARIEISTPMGGRVFNCKTSDIKQTGRGIAEVAPPGAKAERMVKHIKAGYAKDGKLTPKEKSIAYATAWKAHNKGMAEGFATMLANATSRDDLRQIRNFVTEHVTDKNKQRQIMEQATRIVAVQRRKYAAMSAK